MKKIALMCIVMPLLLWSCGKGETRKSAAPGKKNDPQTAAVDLQKSRARINELLERANACSDAGNYAEALAHVRQLLETAGQFPEKPEFKAKMLDFQHYLLLKTGNFREALETAFALEALDRKLSPRRSPWNCLKIAEPYLELNDRDNALAWIEKAVYERNFTRRDVFDLAIYDPLRNHFRFSKVIAAIELKLGLNLPAKTFTVKLLDGSAFSLSGQQGKVVLVDFWDVKCPPCRKEMPNLERLHREFAAKGLVIVGISLDTDKALLRNYLEQTAPKWKMACSYQGWNDPVVRLYSINATPSSWLIDRLGILRHINLHGEELYAAVKVLL